MQFATAGSEYGGPRTIVGLDVTNVGSDMGSVTPMLKDIEDRTGQLPVLLLADANHAKHECIEAATRAGVILLIAVPERERDATTPVSPEVTARRKRMETEEAKYAYRSRHGVCKPYNTHFKSHHGIAPVSVRLAKVKCVAFLGAINANILANAALLFA